MWLADNPWNKSTFCCKVQSSILLYSAGFNSISVEASVLRDRGVSDLVIPALLKTHKVTSGKIYHRTGISYFAWCEAMGFHPCL